MPVRGVPEAMPADDSGAPRWVTENFRVTPLPRWRAVFSLSCAGAAFLCLGGALEYGTGSPETQGSIAASYWALLFLLHVVAFGGAALIGAFPPLAHGAIKLGWLALVGVVWVLAFVVWSRHQPEGAATIGAWLSRWPGYAPAAIALVIGLLLPSTVHVEDDDAQSDPVRH